LWPPGSQDLSQLPTSLLDVLKHRAHLHISVTVTGGDANQLQETITFDPASASQVPEPTAFFTIVAGSLAMLARRRASRCREGRARRRHLNPVTAPD
jgi:hypothetical protein